jgi:glycosyltransferase involved in cell wall biosynthesis
MRPALTRRVKRMLGAADGKPPVVVCGTVDYAFPYRQRPQHLAFAFARLGHPVFYLSPRSGHDLFLSAGFAAPGLCVTDADDVLQDLLDERTILLLMSTDNRVDMDLVAHARSWTPRIVYDYIDHIDPAISLMDIPPGHLEAHAALLRDESVLVVASAQVLYDEAAQLRSRGLVLAQNAVDIAHFAAQRSTAALVPEMADVVRRGKPILGYFGALASWFDYDLVHAVASARPDVSVVLIGPDYDGSLRKWRHGAGELPANLVLVPPVSYDRLPAQAAWFDAAMVPFLVNDITLATSPLKLYEYFALGLPVISTPLPECVRHQPAVLISGDAAGFAAAADRALALRDDPAHRALLAREAAENDWRRRAGAILAALEEMDRHRSLPT